VCVGSDDLLYCGLLQPTRSDETDGIAIHSQFLRNDRSFGRIRRSARQFGLSARAACAATLIVANFSFNVPLAVGSKTTFQLMV
jgi:hypothetical protein